MRTLKSSVAASAMAVFFVTTATVGQAGAADLAPYDPGPYSAPASYSHSTALWAGIGLQEDSFAAHIGGVWAANGNLDATGWLFRGQGIFVDYDFKTTTGKADGELARANASVGYQWADVGYVASLYAGIDIQEHDYDPNGAGSLDDEVGLILTGRLATENGALYPMSLEGNYSTANDSYWARGRVGFRMDGGFTVGPELAVLGNDGYDAWRVGGYAAVNLGEVTLELNAGYHDGDGGSGSGSEDSVYGGATIVYVF